MSKRNGLYIAGSIICFVAIGSIILYAIRTEATNNQTTASQQALNAASSSNTNVTIATAITGQSDNTDTPPANESYSGHSHGQWQNMPAGSKPFFGEISTLANNQITLNSRNNTTTTVTISGSTEFDGGTQDQLATGVRIAGYGTENSDGSITAVKITINPMGPSGGRLDSGMGNQTQQ